MRDSAGVEIVESPAALEESAPALAPATAPALEVGVVDGAPEYQFFRVSSAKPLDDGGFVVANGGTQELRFFDPTGHFLFAQGGQGEGPGEYRFPAILATPFADSIHVFDLMTNRFTVVGVDGSLVRSGLPSRNVATVMGVLDDGRVVSTQNTASARPDSPEEIIVNRVVVQVSDPAATVRDTIGVFDGPDLLRWREGNRIGFSMVPFDVAPAVAARGDGIWVTPGRVPEVRQYDSTGRLLRIMRVLREPQPITQARFDAFVAEQVAAVTDAAAAAMERRHYDAMPLHERMPAFQRLLSDPGGGVWAEEYRPDESAPVRWTVFRGDGVVAGSIALPPGTQLLAIGRSRIIGLRRDEMDVERIVVWNLEPNPSEPSGS